SHHRQYLLDLDRSLQRDIREILKRKSGELDYLQQKIRLLHPDNVLKRGFSITYFQGKILRNTERLKEGTEVETILAQGRFRSTVTANPATQNLAGPADGSRGTADKEERNNI